VTLKQARNLAAMQMVKITPSSVKLLLRGKTNSVLLRNLILTSTDAKVLDSVINHFVDRVMSGDAGAKLFLSRMVSEKFNKNLVSRKRILNAFKNIVNQEESFGFSGLLAGVKDSVAVNRFEAGWGLGTLAEKGDGRVLPGLLVCTRDSELETAAWAFEGLKSLFKGNNVPAKNALKKMAQEGNLKARTALNQLIASGNEEAKKILEELRE
jgi:hypothetical protein